MRMVRMKLLLATLLFSLVTVPAFSQAPLPQQLREDFKPLNGIIIMPVGEEYLIDLDAGKGLVEGDLFSVVEPGERVVHPQTGEVLGSLDKVKGYLQVTRIKSGYSYVRPVGEKKDFSKGEAVRRFEGVRAGFWDYTGAGEGLFAELRGALPALDWQNYSAAQNQKPASPKPLPGGEPPLLFIYKDNLLEVRGASFQILHSYTLSAGSAAPSAAAATIAPVPLPVPVPGGIQVAPPVSASPAIVPTTPSDQSGAIVRREIKQDEGVWTGEEWKSNPQGIEAGDFDGDGKNEIATLFKDRVEISRLEGGSLSILDTVSFNGAIKALTIDGADLDGNGRIELYITAVHNYQLSSLIVVAEGSSYRIAAEGIAYYLHRVQTSGGDTVLLGQSMGDLKTDFVHKVYRMRFDGRSLTPSEEYSAPWQATIFGLQPFADPAGGHLFANISIKDRLQVLRADGEELWESSDVYGGSQVFFQRPDFTGGADFATRDVYLKPRLELAPTGEVLVPVNEGLRFSETFNSMGPCRVVAMQWNGTVMSELWHTRAEEGTLADFRMADIDNDGQQELALLVYYSKEGLFKSGRSALQIFELQ